MTRSKTRAKKKAQAVAGNVNVNPGGAGSEAAEAAAYHAEQQRMLVAQQRQQEQMQMQQKSQQQQLGNGHVHAHHHHHHPQHQQSHPNSQTHSHPHHHHHQSQPPLHQHHFQPSAQDPAELSKKMVPISDKALAMLNHMLGNRGMMQRDPSTGAIDVVLNTELFPNLTLPFPALEVPSKGSGDPEEDIRDVLNKVAGGVLGGITAMQQNMGPNAKSREPGNGSLGNKQVMGAIGGGMLPGGPFPGGKLPNLEDLLKLPIFQTGPNGTMTNDNAPALSKYLFQPHPSSSAPYASSGNTTSSPATNQTSNRGKGKQANVSGSEVYQQQHQAARSTDSNTHLPDSHRQTLPSQGNRPQTDSSEQPRPGYHSEVVRREGREYGTVFDADGRPTTVYDDAHETVVHTCPHCDEVHEPPPHGYTDEEEEYDEDYSYYESEESFEYDDDEEGEVDDDEGIDNVSHLSHPPDDEYDDDELDDEDDEGIPDTFSIGDVENELGPDRENEREEARDFFSRVFGKGKEKQRQEVPEFDGQPGTMGPGGQQPHHVCGPECREPTPRQVSEARHKKELFFEKMKVAFMYDGWPEELLKKKWSELTDQEREYIRRTVLARATDGPICEDEKSKARLMKKGWPESALSKRWSELTDTERKRILQVEAGAGQEDEVSIRTRESMLAAQLMPPTMPGGWAGGGGGGGQGGDKADPVLLSIGGTLVEDAQRADADALREAIIQYGSVSAPYTNGQEKLAFPEITGPNGQAPTLDEPTKAEVRKKLARFHAKATETAKWIMSHLETSSGIDPYLRGSLEEAKQVFEDFRSNFKVPDFLQEQMDVATIMYDDLNGTALSQMQAGPDAVPRSDEPLPPTTNGTGEKKKKKKQKKKKKRKSEGGGQQQGQDQDQGGEAGKDDQDGSEDEANVAPASILDDPEKLDWACNELFQWIKTCLWSIEQDAIRTAHQTAAAQAKSNKKNNGKQSGAGKGKSEPEVPRDIQITWALPDLSQTNGVSKDGLADVPVTNVTWTPRPAPDAEQMRARLKSIGVDVPPAWNGE